MSPATQSHSTDRHSIGRSASNRSHGTESLPVSSNRLDFSGHNQGRHSADRFRSAELHAENETALISSFIILRDHGGLGRFYLHRPFTADELQVQSRNIIGAHSSLADHGNDVSRVCLALKSHEASLFNFKSGNNSGAMGADIFRHCCV